jgi:F5/8 type C domain
VGRHRKLSWGERGRAARSLVALAALCFAVTACGSTGATGSSASIRPFGQVEVGKTRLQVAANGRSAVVQLETKPATVCAIAYGTTTSLGSIADDPDMGGTAITRHTVVLAGLTPGATYRFRLTATDAQGVVFQTRELGTFTTPHDVATLGPDIATGAKVVAVSSQWSSGYKAANAVDGNLSTEWSSAGDGNRAFITIDLGRERAIAGVAFITREMSDGSAITRTFAVIVDGHRRYGPFPAGNIVNARVSRVSFTGRRLRFDVVTSSGGNTGATEIEVFARS